MARKMRRTLLAAALTLVVGVAAAIPGAAIRGAAAGQAPSNRCLDAHHMALVTNAIRRGLTIEAGLVTGCVR